MSFLGDRYSMQIGRIEFGGKGKKSFGYDGVILKREGIVDLQDSTKSTKDWTVNWPVKLMPSMTKGFIYIMNKSGIDFQYPTHE
jgi:hypothetical protein